MEKNTKLEYEIDKYGAMEERSVKEKNLGSITQHDSGMITEKDKMSLARQVLFFSFLLIIIFLGSAFIPLIHDDKFVQLIQQMLPVITLIIGSYFNK
jgi:hypothetical protein